MDYWTAVGEVYNVTLSFSFFLLAFLVNLPFGYWRSKHPKMSWQWLFFIHAPIPGLIAFRAFIGIPFTFILVVSSIVVCIVSQQIGSSGRATE